MQVRASIIRLCGILLLLATAVAVALPAASQETLIYSGPVPVTVQGQKAVLPVEVFASAARHDGDLLTLHAQTNVNDLRSVLLHQLRRLAKERATSCELRLSIHDASIRLAQNRIYIASGMNAEVWLCTNLLETAIGTSSFTAEIGVAPSVRSGRLHLSAVSLSVDGMNETLRSIGGEILLQNLLVEAIERFNRDPKLTMLPQPLIDAGFAYHDISVGGAGLGASTLRVSIVGPNDPVALVTTLGSMR